MKKLIVPVLGGLLMFAAAFGGAFYYSTNRQAWAADKVRDVAEAALREAQQGGRNTAFTARLIAILATSPEGTPPVSGVPMLVIPGVVRYDLDLRDVASTDIAWNGEQKTLTVKAPALVLSEPEIDTQGLRTYADGAWYAADAAALDRVGLRSARGQLLQQAREEAPMRMARDTSRKILERVFAAKLREAGEKARVVVRFADEKKTERDDGEIAAEHEE